MERPPRNIVLVPMPDPSIEDRYCLGSAHVAAALLSEAQRQGLPVALHYRSDLDHALQTPQEIAQEVLKHDPDVVGFGLYVWNQHVSREVAGLVKREAPKTLVVGGGPWVSAEADSFARANPQFDVLISGDGEAAFAEVVRRAITDGGNERFLGIPGVVMRNGEGVTTFERVRVDPNAFPSPYGMGLLDVRYSLRMALRRGCGMHCRYCNWGGGFSVPLSVERLSQDIRWAVQHGAEEIWLVDSAINRRESDLRRVAEAMQQGDPGGELRSCAFLDWRAVNEQNLDWLRRCRMDQMEVGLQSLNVNVQRLAGRRFDRRGFEQAIGHLRRLGRVTVDIILGLPGDDPEGFRRTVDYLSDQDISVHCFLLMALPGSDYSIRRREYGLEFHEDGVPYLIRSRTFTAEELADCAAYFVTRVRRKGTGSDFYPGNPRFPRYPFNYQEPLDAYMRAHEAFGDPLPPPRCVPGSRERGDPHNRLREATEQVFGEGAEGREFNLAGLEARIEKIYRDRVQIDLGDEASGHAEVFLRLRDEQKPAFRRVGRFDIWYGKNLTMDRARLIRWVDALAAKIESCVPHGTTR